MVPFRHFIKTLLTGAGILFLPDLGITQAYAASSDISPLHSQITALINMPHGNGAEIPVVRTIKILTPAAQLSALCAEPELSIAGNNTRLTGNKSVVAQCGTRRKFIQISVHAQGTWWTAKHTLKPGSVITADDLLARTGSLERLPAGLIFDRQQIIGKTTTRSVSRGQPLAENQLRKGWAVVSGQEVDILATGKGFQIRSKGKALGSAAAGQPLRIATRSGQIMTGVVDPQGYVKINLKE